MNTPRSLSSVIGHWSLVILFVFGAAMSGGASAAVVDAPAAFAMTQPALPPAGAASAWGSDRRITPPLALTDFESKVLLALVVLIPAIAAVVASWKKLTGQKETEARNVTGGPLTVRGEKDHVERREHETFRESMERQLEQIWEVVNGLRLDISSLKSDLAMNKSLREANGERLTEVVTKVDRLSDLLHEMIGAMKKRGGA